MEPAKVARRTLFSAFAHDAGVEHNEVGIFRLLGGLPAKAVESGRQLLRVGDVHLTAFGPDVIALGLGFAHGPNSSKLSEASLARIDMRASRQTRYQSSKQIKEFVR